MLHYKGYWSFAPMPTTTTHIVEAECYEDAVDKLTAWGLAHPSCVDEPHDFQVQCLDGYNISCTMTPMYSPNSIIARANYHRINDILQMHYGEDTYFEWVCADIFTIGRCIGGDIDHFTLKTATDIKTALLNSAVSELFEQIIIDEVTYDEAQV